MDLSDEKKLPYRPSPSSYLGSPARLVRAGRSMGKSSSLPPSINLVSTFTNTFRFISTNAAQVAVTADDLLGVCGGIGTTIIQLSTWATSFKLNSVKVWPSAGGSANLKWLVAEAYERDELKDVSLPTGITITESVTFVPPAKTLAAFWQTASTSNIFAIASSVGSIVDVHITYTLPGGFLSTPLVVASAVVGTAYYLPLDGPASHTYTVLGLPTTF
jgi:hypothetical protein